MPSPGRVDQGTDPAQVLGGPHRCEREIEQKAPARISLRVERVAEARLRRTTPGIRRRVPPAGWADRGVTDSSRAGSASLNSFPRFLTADCGRVANGAELEEWTPPFLERPPAVTTRVGDPARSCHARQLRLSQPSDRIFPGTCSKFTRGRPHSRGASQATQTRSGPGVFARLQPCLIGIEACGGAHYWAGKLMKLGQQVRMMAPQFVKPYVKTHNNDSLDVRRSAKRSHARTCVVQLKIAVQQNVFVTELYVAAARPLHRPAGSVESIDMTRKRSASRSMSGRH